MTPIDLYIINGLDLLSDDGRKEVIQLLGIGQEKPNKRVSRKAKLKNCSTGNNYD